MTLTVESPSRDNPLDVLELRHRKRDAALASMLERAAQAGSLRDPRSVLHLLLARERLAPAVLSSGAALPHARSILVERTHLVMGRSSRGIAWPGVEVPVHLVLLVLSPGGASLASHERTVTLAAQCLRQARNRQKLLAVMDSESARLVLREVVA